MQRLRAIRRWSWLAQGHKALLEFNGGQLAEQGHLPRALAVDVLAEESAQAARLDLAADMDMRMSRVWAARANGSELVHKLGEAEAASAKGQRLVDGCAQLVCNGTCALPSSCGCGC